MRKKIVPYHLTPKMGDTNTLSLMTKIGNYNGYPQSPAFGNWSQSADASAFL
jgi:hypothetical protein